MGLVTQAATIGLISAAFTICLPLTHLPRNRNDHQHPIMAHLCLLGKFLTYI